MAECISREATLNLIEHNDKVFHYADERYENVVYATTQAICKVVAEMPAADVQPVNQWISVKDRLPDEGASVLICTNEGIRSVSARYGNRFFITIVEAFTEDTVTHWQPLPEPPKE